MSRNRFFDIQPFLQMQDQAAGCSPVSRTLPISQLAGIVIGVRATDRCCCWLFSVLRMLTAHSRPDRSARHGKSKFVRLVNRDAPSQTPGTLLFLCVLAGQCTRSSCTISLSRVLAIYCASLIRLILSNPSRGDAALSTDSC